MGSVRSGVSHGAHLLGDQCPVVVHAGGEGNGLRVTGPTGDELLMAVEFEAYRSPGRQGEMSDDVLDQHLLLHTEPPTDPGFDDPDLAHRQPQ